MIFLRRFLFAALAVFSLALLLRDVLAIPLAVPLDPNEGWNAYHAMAAMAGHLYPPPQSLVFNNYPPLSFYVAGALGRLLGDNIIAGRILSLLAFAASAGTVALCLRRMGCDGVAAACGALLFASGLLIASDYVAMDDPQLLGHALQLTGLLVLLRGKPVPAALPMAAGLFIKHNLIALPLASALWLLLQDWRMALRFCMAGAAFAVLGLLAAGPAFLTHLASARRYDVSNLIDVGWRFLPWSAAALEFSLWLGLRHRRDRHVQLAILYVGIALAVGLALAPGDGVDVNIFFDAAIALGLTGGLIQKHFGSYGRGAAAMAAIVPLILFGMARFADNNFAYTAHFRMQAPRDIAFLRVHSGPAVCEMPSLCYWAGKTFEIDIFNAAEAIRTGARSDSGLIAQLRARHFRSLQFDSLDDFSLGADVRAALLANYRVDHADDNGVFLIPRT